MKKFLLGITMTGLMVTSAMALDGKVSRVWIKGDDTINVYIIDSSDNVIGKKLVGTADAIKAMYAAVLTGRSLNADMTLVSGTGDNGSGWAQVTLR